MTLDRNSGSRVDMAQRALLLSELGSPIPIGDGDGDPNQFPDEDGDGDRDEAEKQGWGCGRVDIFDMVDIDLFTVVALNMMVLKLCYTGKSEPIFYNYLKPLTSLDEGASRFRTTLKEITDEAGSIAANKKEKMLCMPNCILTPPTDESVIRYTQLSGVQGVDTQSHVIDDVIRQLSFDETELDRGVGFADVVGGGVDSSGLSHDESIRVDDMDLNLNEPVNLNISQVETQSKLLVSKEPDVGRTQKHILLEVSTQEPIVAEVSNEVPIVEEVGTQELSVEDVVVKDYVSSREDGEDAEQGNGQEDKSAPADGRFFYDDEGIDTAYETEYDVQYSKDASANDDVDKYFLVDEENEIVEPDVDVHLFGISMVLPFDNVGITNLVPDDILEREDVDVINADGFDSDPGVINASGQWKYSFYTGYKFTTPKEAKDRVYLHSIESRRNLKLYKNYGVRIRARCDRKVPIFTMSQCTGPTGPNRRMEAGPSGSSGPTTKSKKRKNTCTNDDSQASPSFIDAHDKGDLCPRVLINLDILIKAVQDQLQRKLEVQISMSKAFRAKAKAEREIRGDHCLGDDIDLHLNSNFTFISDRQKGIIPAIKTVYPIASATNVRDFEKCMLKLKTMNPKAHEWLNKIPAEHWARSYFSGRAKSDLLLNNICVVFNGKIVGGRDKPVITLLEYIREYCMKRIVNVQGVIDKM
ncbi:hypothetical protein Tco_1134899 [Tanacetum coccineum]